MKPDFALEDPATFNAVLPWSHFNSAGGKSSRDVASSKLLQEKVIFARHTLIKWGRPLAGVSVILAQQHKHF